MQDNFSHALAGVLAHEGGFSNHPQDPGGPTNKGITLATFRHHYGAEKTVYALRRITVAQVAFIYKTDYWNVCQCDHLPPGIDYVVFDQAVNSSPRLSVRWLQTSLDIPIDGLMGPYTLAAAWEAPLVALIHAMCDTRLAFLRQLGTWSIFGHGWRTRIKDVRAEALRMVTDS